MAVYELAKHTPPVFDFLDDMLDDCLANWLTGLLVVVGLFQITEENINVTS